MEEKKSALEELRECARCGCDAHQLYVIADRIDREMVELPRDADGEAWTGNESEFKNYKGERMHIASFCYYDGTWCIGSEDTGELLSYYADCCRHVHPDTPSSLADELEEAVERGRRSAYPSAKEYRDALLDIADRIRKLAEKEGE